MIRVTNAPSVFDRIASNHISDGNSMSATIMRYWSWTREASDSKRLGDLSCVLLGLILIAILGGINSKDMEQAKKGVDDVLYLLCYIFSLYAMVKAKANANQSFTFGYSRYETIAAFSNCLFLMIASLLLIVDTFHGHDNNLTRTLAESANEGNPQESGHASHNHHNGEETNMIGEIFKYGRLLMSVIGVISFWNYSRFATIEKLEDIGAGSNRFAYVGVGQSAYQEFMSMIEPFYRNVQQQGSSQFKEIESNANTPLIHFTSHYEHMHSVFLLFLVNGIFLVTPMLSETQLRVNLFGDSMISAAIVPLAAIALTLVLVKPLFVILFKVLLQALPIEDEAGIAAVLSELRALKDVVDVTAAKFWGLSASYLVCHMTIRVRKNANADVVYEDAHGILVKKFSQITLQIEEVKRDE